MFVGRGMFLIIYTLVDFYIGYEILHTVQYIIPDINLYLYWIIFVFISFSFIVERYKKSLPFKKANKIIYTIGAYWMAILLYSIIASIIIQILRIFISENYMGFLHVTAVVIIAVLLIYGTYNALSIKVVKYNINIEKNVKKLNIVFVSDIHLGRLIGKHRLDIMVDKINLLRPDILVLGGDIVDDDMNMEDCYDILGSFKNIHTRYGIYSVYGNHEYIGSNTEEIKSIYKKLNINLLIDDAKNIDNRFYIVGRDDRYSDICRQTSRKTVDQLLSTLNFREPVILVDHQPVDLENSKKCGVDIQLSGHTHKGQIYPNNFITRKVFKIDYGHLKEENFNCIVSCGLGTWGPPIRLGSKSEIVQIEVGSIKDGWK